MKRTCKILSLLLVAVMALTLLPNVAFADPPQNDPTHQHKWVVTYNKKATCTEAGKKTWKCSLCGKTYTETYKALGHIWDEGTVTTEPSYFTPGVRTYTCKRDHSHTYTEEIDPTPWLFATLSGTTIDFTTFDLATYDLTPLTITEQPVGGAITRYEDETVHLTCAATGGTGDYTYEWYSKKMYKLWGWNWPNYYGEQTEPDFDAPDGDYKYWCVVTDSAGNTAATEYAEVTYKLRIAKQPDNVNLQSETTDLCCEAADGSGSYTYRWYNSDLVFQGKGASLPVSEEGDYFCTVEDNVTGETVDSEMCTVYSTDPFRLASISEDCTLVPKENVMLVASFTGGVEDYEIWWDKDGGAIDSTEGTDAAGNVVSYVDTAEAGVYTVHGVDSMYATASASVTVTAPKLTIVRQPEGGTIPKDGHAEINVLVVDGEGPYHYTLYRNGGVYLKGTSDTPTLNGFPYGFNVWYPGNYYFRIEDSVGREANSDSVYFDGGLSELQIKKQTESATITKPGEKVTLSVEAEGGKEPYTYLWSFRRYNTRYKVGSSRTFSADKPGEYLCRVTDALGEMIHSETIMVGYTGDTPIITSQPVAGTLKEGSSVYLSCDAVTGSGGELRYEWQKRGTTGHIAWVNVSDSGRGYDVTKPGIYRCKVTDTVSGKSTYTEAATVTNGEIVFIGVKNTVRWSSEARFVVSFQGGQAPWKVRVYVSMPIVDENYKYDHSEYVLYSSRMIYSADELNKLTYDLPTVLSSVEKVDGVFRTVTVLAHYKVVVTDANGKECESTVFGWE